MSKTLKIEDFEQAALPHLNDLFRTALRVVGNRSEAEDIAQETYLQAWKSFDRFEIGTNCRAWLYKIMFHVISHRRRKWFENNLKSALDPEEALEAVLTYEPPVPQHLTDEDVLAVLERLPRQYREVVVLADVEEFSYKEVAQTVGVPLGTVMSRLSRGRKLLRTELAGLAAAYGIGEAKGAGSAVA